MNEFQNLVLWFGVLHYGTSSKLYVFPYKYVKYSAYSAVIFTGVGLWCKILAYHNRNIILHQENLMKWIDRALNIWEVVGNEASVVE